MKRRLFLSNSLSSAAGLGLGARVRCASSRTASMRLDLHSMSRRLLETDRADVPKLTLAWIEAGAEFRDLLGAAYLAGLHEVNPSPIGGQVHAMMMIASAAETSAALRGRRKLLPAFFNLDRVKRSQARDASSRRGDWVMPAAPRGEFGEVREHVTELETAMQKWDEAAGDRAVTALHSALSLDAFFEYLWPWAMRDFRVIGHKIIFATQTYRALQEIGWRHGRDAVRSLTLGILDGNPYASYSDSESKAILALFDHNRDRALRFPADWSRRTAPSSKSVEFLREIRGLDAEAAADRVLVHLERGASEASIWDGLRLRAFELTMQRPSIAGVHTVTSVNALYRASTITRRETTRRLCILQAASWLSLFRVLLEGRSGEHREIEIDMLPASTSKTTKAPFALASFEDASAASAQALKRGRRAAFSQSALDCLARKAAHDHDYKYTVAALEEIESAAPPIQPMLAAASMAMLRREASDDGAVYRAVREHV